MKISRLTFISTIDKIFITSMLTLFSFVWIKYFIRNNVYALLLSFTLSVIIVSLFLSVKKSNLEKKITKIETAKRIDSFMYSIFLLEENTIFKMIYDRISKTENIKLKENILINENTGIIPLLNVEEISLRDIAIAYQTAKKLRLKEITILSISCPNKGKQFSKNIKDIKINILEKEETFYEYIQRYAIYPEVLVAQKSNKKESFKAVIKLSFNKTKIKSYALSGIVMLILSLFFKYNLYYVIVSSILFLFAIISFFFKDKNNSPYN